MLDSPSMWKRTGIWWRFSLLVSIVLIGYIGLAAGVGLSERPDIHQAGAATRLYSVLGLFVFGGLDLGMPTGGPTWARRLLWLAYFGAPAITTSAIVEGILRILRPEAWRLWRLKDHIVVAGCGRFAQLFMLRIRDRDPGRRLLVIERSADSPHLQAVSETPRTEVLLGDITSEAVLRSLRLEKAQGVLLLAGDDYANLDAASRISAMHPELTHRIVAHVSDIQLLRLIEQKNLLPGVRKFNGYRKAAGYLVQEILRPHFELTERLDTVVLAGFGRFGQTVLAELQSQAEGLFQTVVLIDLEAGVRHAVFGEQVGFRDSYTVHIKKGDLKDPALWAEVHESLGNLGTRPVFVLGCGRDSDNIRTALWLSDKFNDARIVARCFDQSSFTRDISQEGGFEIVSTADLLRASLESGELLPGADL